MPDSRPEARPARYWRDEILQVLHWLRGEGFDQRITAAALERFLGLDPSVASGHLDALVQEGLVEPTVGGYVLSEEGRARGPERVTPGEEQALPPPARVARGGPGP
ncbi:MAG: MarR family transcriptional regulator [Actinomycetota bacterium]|nr:MarR family transcriptional regulator [Actinomycetota bacterium]